MNKTYSLLLISILLATAYSCSDSNCQTCSYPAYCELCKDGFTTTSDYKCYNCNDLMSRCSACKLVSSHYECTKCSNDSTDLNNCGESSNYSTILSVTIVFAALII